ncbi:MAG: hypothetical protein KDA61_01590, partial [Planctomycetales bacterium]|nr:hypothetical protein [Planctomycetales bacterium]
MLMGLVAFLAYVLFASSGEAQAKQAGVLTYAAVGLACLALPSSLAAPRLVPSSWSQNRFDQFSDVSHLPAQDAAQPDPVSLLVVLYQTRFIIASAILEGAAFFNLVAHMIERQTITLVVTGVLLAMMAVRFPSRQRFVESIEGELR